MTKEKQCDGECHYQEPYGFVPHAGCPLHDSMTEEQRKAHQPPQSEKREEWEEDLRLKVSFDRNQDREVCILFIQNLLEAKEKEDFKNVGMLRQWLNERPTNSKLLTNEDILHWLKQK